MFRKIKIFFVGLGRLILKGLKWLGNKILQGLKWIGGKILIGLRAIWRGICIVCRWLADLPYKAMGMHVMRNIGKALHKILFDFLLPKKYRNATKQQLYDVIFKSNTIAGRKFDIWLLVLISLNIIVMIVETTPGVLKVPWLRWTFYGIEWAFTILFTFEYYLRIYCLKHPMKYVTSFFGIIDFLSIFPAYLGLFIPAARTFSVLRLLRLLRIFVILDLKAFVREGRMLLETLWRSFTKIVIFMLLVFVLAVILGSLMFMAERKVNLETFHSIGTGIYWAVVTLTTVGYGDVTPVTPLGRLIAIIVMILGYSIIAVPSGVVAGETIEGYRRSREDAKVTRRDEKWMNDRLAPKLQAGEDAKIEEEEKRQREKEEARQREKKAKEMAKLAKQEARRIKKEERANKKKERTLFRRKKKNDMIEEQSTEMRDDELDALKREAEMKKPREVEIVKNEEPKQRPIIEESAKIQHKLSEEEGFVELVKKQQAMNPNEDKQLNDLLNLLEHEEDPKDDNE